MERPWSHEAIFLILRHASKHSGPWESVAAVENDEEIIPDEFDTKIIVKAREMYAALKAVERCDESQIYGEKVCPLCGRLKGHTPDCLIGKALPNAQESHGATP